MDNTAKYGGLKDLGVRPNTNLVNPAVGFQAHVEGNRKAPQPRKRNRRFSRVKTK